MQSLVSVPALFSERGGETQRMTEPQPYSVQSEGLIQISNEVFSLALDHRLTHSPWLTLVSTELAGTPILILAQDSQISLVA